MTGRARRIIVMLLPVLGGLLLFSSWVVQQTLLGEANASLQRIEVAEGSYATYQSNNALFNAMREIAQRDEPLPPAVMDSVLRFQAKNYELGLHPMEAVLKNEEVHASLPPAANPDDLATPPDAIIETTQARLGQIQLALRGEKRSIEDDKRERTGLFIALYAVGSIIVLAGTAVSAADPRVIEG
jgi:hypothetical protein